MEPWVDSNLKCFRVVGVSSGESCGSRMGGTKSVGSMVTFSRSVSCTRVTEIKFVGLLPGSGNSWLEEDACCREAYVGGGSC